MAIVHDSHQNTTSNKSPLYVREISKARYISIFLKDVILTLTLFILNMILGSLLLMKQKGSETNYHAIVMLILHWLPSIFLIPIRYNIVEEKALIKFGYILTTFCLEPIIPSILAVRTLCGEINDSDQLKRLKRTCLLSQMTHTSIFLILTIFLMIRGTIDLEVETCVVDQLGRGTCLSSLAIIAVTSAFVLCIAAASEYREDNNKRFGINCCNVFFRTISIAFVVNYLDYWSIIPLSIIILINLIIIKHKKKNHVLIDDIDTSGKFWNGQEWMYLSPTKDPNKHLLENIDNYDNDVDKYINLFMEACLQTVIPNINYKAVSINGTILMTLTLTIIAYLVNIDVDFNYEVNILNNQMFNTLFILLIILGITSIILCWKQKFIQEYLMNNAMLHVIFCIIYVSFFSIVMVISFSLTRPTEVYFFTITKTFNNSYINVHPFKTVSYFSKHEKITSFNFEEIHWSDQPFVNRKIKAIFCNELHDCDIPLNVKTYKFYIQNPKKNYRSSSPKNSHKVLTFIVTSEFNMDKIKDESFNSEFLYFSTSMPNENILSNLLHCDNQSRILVNPPTRCSKDCNSKYIDQNNTLNQNVSVIMKNSAKIVNLKCKKIDDNFELISNNSKLEKTLMNLKSGLVSDFCCFDKTIFLSFYGYCNKYDSHELDNYISRNMTLKSNVCLKGYFTKNTFKILDVSCVVQVYMFNHCFSSKILQCDAINFSCNKRN